MTFTEWYKNTQNDDWHEDYALMYSFASKMTDGYEEWCLNNSKSPVWNG